VVDHIAQKAICDLKRMASLSGGLERELFFLSSALNTDPYRVGCSSWSVEIFLDHLTPAPWTLFSFHGFSFQPSSKLISMGDV
jgi:hypothetical protein